jgi:nucleoid DNA-binding protein
MSIEYKIVKKAKPGIKNSNEFSYCPVISCREKITMDKITKDLATSYGINEVTTLHVFNALEHYIAEKLNDGHPIHLNTLGILSPTLTVIPAESEQKIDSKSIVKVNVRFKPNKKLRESLLKASFVKVE